jgi:FtsP/CotA-like multicopper oxidase with cupredoxin domain
MLTRRTFLKFSSAGVLTLYTLDKFGVPRAIAAIPGGTLPPSGIPKFVMPLVKVPAMPQSGFNKYKIAARQFKQRILPPGLPTTTVWGYGSTSDASSFHSPAYTIETKRGTRITVTWVNDLTDGKGKFLPHLLPVDPTLHWANPPNGSNPELYGVGPRDSRPTFTTTPGPYKGPVPLITHAHGIERVEDWSDGYPEAWYLPAAENIPSGYAQRGTWFQFFSEKADRAGVPDWERGQATFRYPNSQRPSTAWFHDHTLGMTHLNVYAGLAGMYIVRSDASDDHPSIAGSGARAVLPGPAPDAKPEGKDDYYELPLVIQDRAFNVDGSLFYPNTREFFDEFAGPYIPASDVPPIWNPEFFGNCIMVNGRTWPWLDVEPRRYRFRVLNGCQSRFLILKFSEPAVEMWQIGAEGGYLRAPVKLSELLMAPAERADLIVDFSGVKRGANVMLLNVGPDEPFGGPPFDAADPASTGLVMQCRVKGLRARDDSTHPSLLRMPELAPLTGGSTRSLALLEMMSAFGDMPIAAHLGTFDPNVGTPGGIVFKMWHEPESETPNPGATEVWELYNFTEDAHPIHIHEVFFEVVNRQPLDPVTGVPIDEPREPEPTENGRKDTVIAYPGEVTRVRMTFGPGGQYVWHCHILEHEDNEMMRPYRIGPEQPGQPAG